MINRDDINLSFNNKIQRLFNLAIGIAIIDGGAIIAIQIINFLLSYFGPQLQQVNAQQSSTISINPMHILISLLSVLNLIVIIFRVSSITRGVRPPIMQCYAFSLRRLPAVMLLYMICSTVFLAISIQLNHFFPGLFANLLSNYSKILFFILFAIIPIGISAAVFVIDQHMPPFRAIGAVYHQLRYKVDLLVLGTISILYSVPMGVGALLKVNAISTPYFALLTTLWLLFCHILSILVFMDSLEKQPTSEAERKPTKVVII